jgi:hypothetical protein
MSAIPWVGQDIVEFIWGGLNNLLIEEPNNSNVVQQILLNAGISPILVLGYVYIIIFNIGVKSLNQGDNQQGSESYLISKPLRD